MDGLARYMLESISNYQYYALFLFLSLGMIGLPIPDEFLMMFSGFQVGLGRMSYSYTILIASLGSFFGMNITYWIGRKLGKEFLQKLGPYFSPNEKRFAQAESWFRRFGNRLIIVGYFLPGFRQLLSYFAGMSQLNYRRYLLLTGSGSIFWTTTFVSLGLSLGIYWKDVMNKIHGYLMWGAALFGIVVLFAYFHYTRQKRTRIL